MKRRNQNLIHIPDRQRRTRQLTIIYEREGEGGGGERGSFVFRFKKNSNQSQEHWRLPSVTNGHIQTFSLEVTKSAINQQKLPTFEVNTLFIFSLVVFSDTHILSPVLSCDIIECENRLRNAPSQNVLSSVPRDVDKKLTSCRTIEAHSLPNPVQGWSSDVNDSWNICRGRKLKRNKGPTSMFTVF